ncbi:hypothetical protein G9A89_012814 [Geosiphon pyriformis]|nr:hypothetical protein G9A89_012814 [Geosiphon pyriformis]
MSDRQSIIVTGASRGIGHAVTLLSIQKFNSNVVAIARSENDLNLLKTHIQKELGLDGRLEIIVGDVTNDSVLEAAVQKSLVTWGRLDGIVASAGAIEPIGPISEAQPKEWKRHFDINFFSVLSLVQKSIPHLRIAKGRVINVSSGAANHTYYGWGAYCTSKAGLNMLTKCLATEEPDITFIAIRPGVVDTAMQALIREKGSKLMSEKDYKYFTSLFAEKKLVPVHEPSYVIANLATGDPSTLNLSGGFYDWNGPELAAFQKK